jgi:predicted nucleotidyltransferase
VTLPEFKNGFKWAGCLGGIEDELKELLGVDVDVADEASLKGEIRETILREAIRL